MNTCPTSITTSRLLAPGFQFCSSVIGGAASFNCTLTRKRPSGFAVLHRRAWAAGVRIVITHKSSRIDDIFFVPGSALELVSMENVETPTLVGVEASDHRPQVAVFRMLKYPLAP